MKKIGIVSQARMTSTRLPGKILKSAGGLPMLKHHANRLLASGIPLFVATTTNATDDPVAAFCEREGINCFRGDEQHVLSRYRECAAQFGLDVVVRVTSDCPLIDGEFLARGVRHYQNSNDPWLYLSSGLSGTIPRGFDFEIFSVELLELAFQNASAPQQIEHVTPYLYDGSNARVNAQPYPYTSDKSQYRVTLDTAEDLRLIRVLIEQHDAHLMNIDGIVELLDRHPELVAINAHVEQKKLTQPAQAPVHLNRYGYYEVTEKPSQDELNNYYSTKYYQNEEASHYSLSYRPDEVDYFNNKIAQKHQYLVANGLLDAAGRYRLLDVGCGEGYALNYFKQLGWDVTGLDFSRFGCETCNPQCLDNLIVGDIYQNLARLTGGDQRYDVIWLDNVLEHVLDPLDLLQRLRQISTGPGILIIDVPNDFSAAQQQLYQHGELQEQSWVVIPDHLSYFNKAGLTNLCKAANWEELGTVADFPIDWFLFNPHSNYYADRDKGKAAHRARVTLENMLHNISVEKTNELYKTLADLGMGRQLVGYFRKVE